MKVGAAVLSARCATEVMGERAESRTICGFWPSNGRPLGTIFSNGEWGKEQAWVGQTPAQLEVCWGEVFWRQDEQGKCYLPPPHWRPHTCLGQMRQLPHSPSCSSLPSSTPVELLLRKHDSRSRLCSALEPSVLLLPPGGSPSALAELAGPCTISLTSTASSPVQPTQQMTLVPQTHPVPSHLLRLARASPCLAGGGAHFSPRG